MIGKAFGSFRPNWLFCTYIGLTGRPAPSAPTAAAEKSLSNNLARVQLENVIKSILQFPNIGGILPHEFRHMYKNVSACGRVRCVSSAVRTVVSGVSYKIAKKDLSYRREQ